MRWVKWPDAAKIQTEALTIAAHSVGGEGLGGHYAFEVGPGARWHGTLSVAPQCPEDAAELRAMFHALRGRSGWFTIRLPSAPALTASACTLDGNLTRYSDCTRFTDGTQFSDSFKAGANGVFEVAGTGSISSDSDSLTVSSAISASALFKAGAYAFIGAPGNGGQLFRIVSVSGSTAVVRPRARAAFSGAVLSVGAVRAAFRLAGETPRIPMTGQRSQAFTFEVEEVY